ncbi:MAG: FAD-binding oxidoreductase [Actinomycetia bacterium]|nr:FAD-binding oxidoreductase [Actinomycetes bacterium]
MTPHADRPGVLVIGAGVSGLTTALVLARRGWHVNVLADAFGADTVTTVAGAVWEFPPSVCGRHHDQDVLARSEDWAMTSYHRFAQLAANPHTGVSLRPAVFYFRQRVEDNPGELEKMRKVEQRVPGFLHDPALVAAHGVNPDTGVIDAYSYLAATVDTDRYLAWLSQQAHAAGVTITHRAVSGPLVAQEQELRAEFSAEVIVNCTGLGSVELCGDTSMDPHRGALIRVLNDGTTMPPITAVHAVANDTTTAAQNMIFIVPRGEDRLLIGGLVEPGRWGTDLTADDRAIRDMLARAVEFLPILREAQPDPTDPLRVGLRPFRTAGVRVEAQPGTRIVHNYGHGGAGVTLSWGCAGQVADIAGTIEARETVPDGATSSIAAMGSTR